MICTKCKLDLPIENFSKNSWKKSGYNGYCKICQKAYKDKHYRDNKDDYLLKNDNKRKELSKFVYNYKKEKGCHFCGENQPVCLEFHHINPDNKIDDVSKIMWSCCTNQLMIEIEKCVILCANCHRKLHAGIIQLEN